MENFDKFLLLLAKREYKTTQRLQIIESELQNIKEALALIIEHQIENK